MIAEVAYDWRRRCRATEGMTHPILNAILPNDLVFDLGANTGEKVQLFLERGARIVAVEPQPAMVEVLRSRYQDNPNVVIVPQGVASGPGTLTMNIDAEQPVLSSFKHDWKEARFKDRADWSDQVSIEMTTLDLLIAKHGTPRYIKIDVEGFEVEVVKGLTVGGIPLSIEFVGEGLADSADACSHLEQIGYRSFNATFGDHDSFVFKDWVGAADLIGFLLDHRQSDPLVWGDIYAT